MQDGRRIIIRVIAICFLFVAFTKFIPSTVAGSRLCAGCHAGAQAFASWRKSPHLNTACMSCHGEPGIGGFIGDELRAVRNGLQTVVYTGSDATIVSNDACTSCHIRIVEDTIVRNGVRIDHEAPQAAGWRCSDCHGGIGHKLRSKGKTTEPTYDKCFSCHRVGGPADYRCRVCHADRMVPKRAPGSKAGALNHDKRWSALHGQANLATCRNCHGASFCRECHSAALPHSDSWITAHGRAAKAGTTTCPDCHRRVFCGDCHGVAMPHPRPYYPRHAGDASGGAEICRRCHDSADCTKCHTAHVKHPIVK